MELIMLLKNIALLLLLFVQLITAGCSARPAQILFDTPLTISDIRIRDPFIYVEQDTGTYYLYAQMDNRLGGSGDSSKPKGVEVYRSRDLQHWSEPETVLLLGEECWARNMVWAPEVHAYDGRYYLFVTLTSHDLHEGWVKPEGRDDWPNFYKRGTQIFQADSPAGPFLPFANGPHTPEEWMALDGTFWVEDGKPYMVFCHEWVETIIGTMDVVELSVDLSEAIGEPVRLFDAQSASWCRGAVTDGCYLWRSRTGELLMIWSNGGPKGYAIGIVCSPSGSVHGPWIQQDDMLFAENGGHGMIFVDLDGRLRCALHQPNSPSGKERLILYGLDDQGDTLRIIEDAE